VSIKTLSSKVVYENPWLSVREDEVEFADGTRGTHALVERADFALVIPADNDGFHLVEQYRYATKQRSWEFPSGSFPPGVTGTVEEMAAPSWPRRPTSSPASPNASTASRTCSSAGSPASGSSSWCATAQTWSAVSEIARRRGRRTRGSAH
jgi:hypothetical protein